MTDDLQNRLRSGITKILHRRCNHFVDVTSSNHPDLLEAADELERLQAKNKAFHDGLELAWGLIANSYGGDWQLAPPQWRHAAERWRDEVWHPSLPKPDQPKEAQ